MYCLWLPWLTETSRDRKCHAHDHLEDLFTCMLGIGLNYGIIGPSLIDLKTQLSADLASVSVLLPSRAGGYALGSFLMGFLYKKYNFFPWTHLTK